MLRLCKPISPRQLDNTEISDFPYEARRRVFGDSWFASVKTTVQLWKKYGLLFVGVVKTAHAKYPKIFLEKTMKDWPAGSHLLLEAVVEDVPIIAIGYKYNSRKVICFVCHKEAGDTELTDTYEAKWKDENNNTVSRLVPRPTVIGDYFKASNTIDCHNEMRQFFLKLEKHWITTDGFFRIITTFFGITITDAWNAYKHHLGKNHRHRNLSIIEFADMLLKDCLENEYTAHLPEDTTLHIPKDSDGVESSLTPASIATIRDSATATAQSRDNLAQSFSLSCALIDAAAVVGTETTAESQSTYVHGDIEANDSLYHVHDTSKGRAYKRKRRGKCSVCGMHTPFYCMKCDELVIAGACKARKWLCGAATGRDCVQRHKSLF